MVPAVEENKALLSKKLVGSAKLAQIRIKLNLQSVKCGTLKRQVQ